MMRIRKCSDGHQNIGGSYGSEKGFEFCEICGKHIVRSMHHYSKF